MQRDSSSLLIFINSLFIPRSASECQACLAVFCVQTSSIGHNDKTRLCIARLPLLDIARGKSNADGWGHGKDHTISFG